MPQDEGQDPNAMYRQALRIWWQFLLTSVGLVVVAGLIARGDSPPLFDFESTLALFAVASLLAPIMGIFVVRHVAKRMATSSGSANPQAGRLSLFALELAFFEPPVLMGFAALVGGAGWLFLVVGAVVTAVGYARTFPRRAVWLSDSEQAVPSIIS